jgi:hypothetical protein
MTGHTISSSAARWYPDDLGTAVARLVIALLVPDGTRWRSSSMTPCSGEGETGYGNNCVVLAVRVRLPMISRPVAVPVTAKVVIKDRASASRLWLARRMVTRP